MSAEQAYKKAVEELQSKFLDELPNKISSIQSLFEAFSTAQNKDAALQPFLRQVHSLTGSSGTFGMGSLSVAAQQLEALLKETVDFDVSIDKALVKAISEKLLHVEVLAKVELDKRVNRRQPPQLVMPLSSSPVVYLFSEQEKLITQVGELLADSNYQLKLFSISQASSEAVKSAAQPAAIILDAPAQDISVTLAEINANWSSQVPAVLIADNAELSEKQLAYRAGACRFIRRGELSDTLIHKLDILTNRLPADPYRVLLIDDDPLQSELQSTILESAGLLVKALDEPIEALQLMDTFQPDVVLLGVYLSEISGPELAAIIREQYSYHHLPIIFLSADGDISQQMLALKFGGDDYLVKPVAPEHLLSAVSTRARRARHNAAIQQRLQTAYYEREREHQALNQHAIVSIADATGTITYVNEMFCQVSGYAQHELIGQNHRILKSEQHEDAFYEQIWSTITSGEIWSGNVCNRRKDGSLYWVESTITPFIDENGKPYQYISIRTDITHIKEAEEKQRSENQLMALLVEIAGQLQVVDSFTFRHCLQEMLASLAVHLKAEHAFFLQLADDRHTINDFIEWHQDATEPSHQNKFLSAQQASSPWWWQQLLSEQQTVSNSFLNLCSQQMQETACCLPLLIGNKLHAVISFQLPSINCSCDVQMHNRLELIAGMVTSTMMRIAGEAKLSSTADELTATLESTSDGIVAFNDSGELLFINDRFKKMWGIEQDIPTESDIIKRMSSYLQTMDFSLDDFIADNEFKQSLALNDGRFIDFQSVKMQQLHLSCGKVWTFHDVTEQVQAEKAAELAKSRLNNGQIYANIGTWELNILTGEVFWSDRIPVLFGYAAGQLETSYDNFLRCLHPDDREPVITAVNASIEHDLPYEIEHRVVWPDGSIHWILERGRVERDEHGKAISMVGIAQDISELKQAQFTLTDAREEAENANRAKSEFLSSMSHELRTPMNAILGFGQLLEYSKDLSDRQNEYIKEILKAGGHLLELINDVLDLSKIESGTIELSIETVDLHSVLQECFSLLNPLAIQKNISLTDNSADGLVVRADRTRLKQVLINLISNAIKYNAEGGDVTILTEQDADDTLRILVRDTGYGIPAEKLDAIFLPFNRVGQEDSEIEGTGIGLTITHRIVEMMAGQLGVESTEGVGSTFWLTLPVLHAAEPDVDKKQLSLTETEQPVAALSTDLKTVLYIEDNPSNLKLMTQIFAELPQSKLITAHTPSLGIELAQQHQPAVILLDINMPGMDGYQVLSILQKDPSLSNTPVIAVTANAMPADIKRGEQAGFYAYLSKPLEIDKFLTLMEKLLFATELADSD